MMSSLPLTLFSILALTQITPLGQAVVAKNVRCPRMQKGGCSLEQRSWSRQTITFGLMLSFVDLQKGYVIPSSFNDGHDLAPAVYLAVKQVNNRSDLLKDYDIQITRLDGGCDVSSRTVLGINELFCSCEPLVGIIGPSCDDSSRAVSQFTNYKEFSVITINYDSQTNELFNRRYEFGILGSGRGETEAIVHLIQFNHWNNTVLLFPGDSTIESYRAKEVVRLVKLSGYQFKLTLAIYDNFIPLREVKESFSRIIIILALPSIVNRVLCLAYHEGLMFPMYQWVFLYAFDQDFHEISFTYAERHHHCSDSQIHSSVHGSINFFVSALTDDQNLDPLSDAGIAFKEYRKAYELQALEYSHEFGVRSVTSAWAKGFYDAVWVLAIALNDSLVHLNMSLTEYKPGSQLLAESVRNQLLNIDFQGISGRVKFNKIGLNTQRISSVYQYGPNGSSQLIALYNKSFTFPPNTSKPRFIDAEFDTQYVQINIWILIIIIVITIVTLTVVICSHVMNILYRKHRAIKASTPMLNHLIFLGCYLIITGTVINVASYHRTIVESDPALKPTMCTLFIWLISIGFTLFTGTICAKTWRLNRISQCAKEFKKNVKFIEWYHLVGFVCVLVAYDVFICSLWHSIDPFKISLTKQVVIEMEDPLLTVMITCQSTYAAHFNAAVIIPQVAVIIMSFMMAVSTNINIKEFSTSNIITLNYLQSVIIFGLELPVYIIATIRGFDSSIRDTLLCISLEVPVCIGIILLYLPLIHNHCMCLHVRTRTLFSKLSET